MGIRWLLPFEPDLLPTFSVVIGVCVVTMAAGLWAGFTTMVVGGALAWRFILWPETRTLAPDDIIAMTGYFMVTSVILGTTELYRRSEQRRLVVELAHAKERAENQQLFASELSHRLKNSLSIVQSMALQSFGSETPEFLKFAGRLHALAAANKLLNSHVARPSADVREVVEAAVQPFRGQQDPFCLSGPARSLGSQDVVSLTIALHELATNAVKYGALSDPKGRVAVTWTTNDGTLVIEWKEHDGPPVTRPTTSGFGSRLLKRAAMGAELEYEADGIRCTIRAR
ncbi:sensor histidine kinase [Sphingomonas sediminicola]|uniref:histidine kinase n=1 Tax=Sphingomonas sediminicola TaxID=386874 RepID=A0ABX6TA98_9SPHN|nr:sensor histidine kinase [Sphingomonas sediminicola]QNP46321.1 sensor histidine kinase [Sphingomonas sediminicola]